jgi:hypothetical protein
MWCCLMIFLLKCLVTLLQNPQPLSHSKYVQNPTFQLGPTDIFIPEPPSSFGLSHCQNPNNSDPPIWISVPPRWPCQLSVIVCTYFGLTEFCKSVSPRWLANSLLPYCFTSVPPSWCNRCHRDEDCPSPCTSVHPSCSYRSHRYS